MTAAAARIRILRDGAERAIDVAAGTITIGRGAGQTVRLVEDDVAPEHAVLHVAEGAWHLDARAPLTVDGAAVAAGARASLGRGARLAIARWIVIVDDPPAGSQAAGVSGTASLARELMRDLLGGDDHGGGLVLRVTGGPGTGQTVVLPPAPSRLVIGRGEGADALILDPDLSRAHIEFDRTLEGVRVIDLGSKNGTRVAGVAAPVDPPGALLRDGDTISAGATVLQFHDPAEEFLRALDPPPVPLPDLSPTPGPTLLPIVIAIAIAALAIIALLFLLV